MPHRCCLPVWLIVLVALVVGPNGCVLAPRGWRDEKNRATETGRGYDKPFEERTVPQLPDQPSWRDVLHRAFFANGDLEAAYFEWAAALSRVPQVAEYPNTNIAPSFSYLFSGDQMKAWDRTTIGVGFDPMENLSFPTKVAKAGEIAFEQARAAAKKFEAAKFELQRKVLTAYLELVMHEEKIRIQTENVSLLRLLAQSAADRVQAGGSQQDLLRAQTQHQLAENELETMKAQHMGMKAMLNGLLALPADAPLNLPPGIPAPRHVDFDDARLIAAATHNSPDLQRLAHDVAGRSDALELARMAYIPDINPLAAFTGNTSQMIGAMIVLPTTIHEIRGRIDEARATLRASQAVLRQTRSDRAANFVSTLYTMRNAERQAEVLRQTILPLAEQAVETAREGYTTGRGSFPDVIEAQRTLLDVRVMIVDVQIERELRLAEMENLAGVDIETLASTTGSSTARSPHEARTATTQRIPEGH